MPLILLEMKCAMTGITELKPSEPETFRWYLKIRCTNCGESPDHWQYVTLNDILEMPSGRGQAHLVERCKLCNRTNTLGIQPEYLGAYLLDKNEQWKTMIAFDCRGLEPTEFDPRIGWQAVGAETNEMFNDIDLSDKEQMAETASRQPDVEVRKDNAKEIYAILKAINFREYITFHFGKAGMRIICDDNHCQQATAYIEESVFKSFDIKENSTFRIPLVDVMEVLAMLDGNNVEMKLTYAGYGSQLNVALVAEEDEYVVQANIHTLEAEAVQDFGNDFKGTEIRMSTIMRPEILKDAIRAIEESCSIVTLYARPLPDGEGGKVSFISKSDVGKITTTFSSSSSMVDVIEVSDVVRYNYNSRLFKRMTYAGTISNKVSICIDCQGTLRAQFLLERPTQEQIFIEFYCVAEQDDD